jgi:hypothetical protein
VSGCDLTGVFGFHGPSGRDLLSELGPLQLLGHIERFAERRLAVPTGGEEDLDTRGIVQDHGPVQSRLPHLEIAQIWISPMADEDLDDIGMPEGEGKCGRAVQVIISIDVCPMLDEHPHGFDMTVLGGEEQGISTIAELGIRIDASSEESFDAGRIALTGSVPETLEVCRSSSRRGEKD